MQSAAHWLEQFGKMAAAGVGPSVASQFEEHGCWRDYLPFGWTMQTLEGRSAIADFASANGVRTGAHGFAFDGAADAAEGLFSFFTKLGRGRGHLRLRDGRCHTLFTSLTDIDADAAPVPDDRPFVLVVGGGQAGLALGAQLSDLGVPYLIVDKYPRVGDQWRSRYDSLVLHDPVWYDHMPFLPFPKDWPVFTPKDQMGDWLQTYAEKLALKIATNTECTRAHYNEASARWQVTLRSPTGEIELEPTHLVFALGISGFAKVPQFEGREQFAGVQMHSSQFKGGHTMANQNVVVIGANNSAHDIATDLVKHGAQPIMLQRSSTLVVRQQDYCEELLGEMYSQRALDAGVTTENADIIGASIPIRLLEALHRPIWQKIASEQQVFYQRLTDSGFRIDFAEDGTGLGLKYRRTASGYYIDMGGSEMVCDGRIAIRSGVNVDHLSVDSVVLDSGESLPADSIVYATGYGTMTDWVAAIIDTHTADRRPRPVGGRASQYVDADSSAGSLVYGRQSGAVSILLAAVGIAVGRAI